MYKYIILCLCVSLSSVLCDLDKEEGAACEWDGVKGKCVKETQCLTTLDTRGDPHPVCSKQGDVTIVCCTDCELVNNTRNVVLSPNTGYYWKDGSKARDNCLQYLDKLPYRCREGGFYSGISKNYDEEKKCHTAGLWGVGGAPPPGSKPGAMYPHQVLLGYGEDLETAEWLAGGSIISDRYILTAGHVGRSPYAGNVKFVALGVEKRSDSPSAWQTHKVKRFISHPDYKAPIVYNDIALIETDTPIIFDKNVLPACLHVEAAEVDTAISTTWRNLTSKPRGDLADTIQTINLEKSSNEECKAAYEPLRNWKHGVDFNTQMCYGSKSKSDYCKGFSGEPLLVETQFSRCIYTIIGVTSFSRCSGSDIPGIFTRVAHYKPWIESVVWP
ncbi:hypothetical protein PYW07_013095 [Mythimna separata]|uniref:Peptidase S1 domain-containing protein n=1 Tax=Mythimna separata TaxID=271217 RepID=A0AAD7Y5N8_MYTSE|nr:hypothetical protein PYW07_013095 [Mythimna separata]